MPKPDVLNGTNGVEEASFVLVNLLQHHRPLELQAPPLVRARPDPSQPRAPVTRPKPAPARTLHPRRVQNRVRQTGFAFFAATAR